MNLSEEKFTVIYEPSEKKMEREWLYVKEIKSITEKNTEIPIAKYFLSLLNINT